MWDWWGLVFGIGGGGNSQKHQDGWKILISIFCSKLQIFFFFNHLDTAVILKLNWICQGREDLSLLHVKSEDFNFLFFEQLFSGFSVLCCIHWSVTTIWNPPGGGQHGEKIMLAIINRGQNTQYIAACCIWVCAVADWSECPCWPIHHFKTAVSSVSLAGSECSKYVIRCGYTSAWCGDNDARPCQCVASI